MLHRPTSDHPPVTRVSQACCWGWEQPVSPPWPPQPQTQSVCKARIPRPPQGALPPGALPRGAPTRILVSSHVGFWSPETTLTHVVFQHRGRLATVTKHRSDFSYYFFANIPNIFQSKAPEDAIFISPVG